ncbi:MAG: 50S ribosomal protein L6 [Desulfococcus sp.]|nr:MAG: 50S ribosomal protein L6 [Desulfococcus sp.]
MSRLGKKPIPIPEKTTASIDNDHITVKGPKGELVRKIDERVKVTVAENVISVAPKQDNKTGSAFQGMMRSLINNMVTGVSTGFERVLEINGIGYRAEVSGNRIVLSLGFSHPVNVDLPDGITATVEKNTILKLAGYDKEVLGRLASNIRRLRPPEPYKGKGIKYADEYIMRKAGKTGTK